MEPRERNQWNRDFAAAWRQLQSRDLATGRRALVLDTQLTVAARRFRDQGQAPVPTAAGLYMGTQDAKARLS